MPPPWATLGFFAVGMLLAIGGFVYNQYRERRNNQHSYSRRSSPRSFERGRNLTCPICGRRISDNSYEMPCGHQFHRGCYADRLLHNRDTQGIAHMPCPICGELGDRLSDNGISAVDGLSDRRVNCSYCSGILTSSERIQLDCGHFAHSICEEQCGDIQQCPNCSGNRTGDHKCSTCEMPIQSSDRNLKQLDCGHLIHSSCSSIAKFMKCRNCPRTEGDPVD
ncbi:uncharacterized protein LOC107046202 [Diachasma alloeum]|uniref:uncharacterized protein LOC107046202 n=1 Tax=Diachasma alloeum TaxID=454923 RepID=UPI0007384C11|nr:uncharacterized protein LOC107046202 [Diachasma alloeum]